LWGPAKLVLLLVITFFGVLTVNTIYDLGCAMKNLLGKLKKKFAKKSSSLMKSEVSDYYHLDSKEGHETLFVPSKKKQHIPICLVCEAGSSKTTFEGIVAETGNHLAFFCSVDCFQEFYSFPYKYDLS